MSTRIFLFALSLFTVLYLPAQNIYTFAGNGTAGSSGNGVPATSAQLTDPLGVCTDNAGNIYIADNSNHLVRKVNAAGIITTFAGNGTAGNSGDGGLAVNAQLTAPYSVCSDNAGNIYISDEGACVIRKVNSSGIISTYAGNGSFAITGDGGPAILAGIGGNADICIDNSGNLYITDFSFCAIRKVNTAGIITTIAGTGNCGYSGNGGPATSAQIRQPTGIAVDNNGNIYFTEESGALIRKVNSSGIISTFAGGTGIGYSGDGGPATAALLSFTYGVFVDSNGNVYIGDTGNGVVRKVDPSGIITTIAGTGVLGYSGDGGPALAAQLATPGDMCMDNAGNLYICDGLNHVVRRIGNCALSLISTQPVDQSICGVSGNAGFTVSASGTTGFQWQINTGSGWNDISNDATYNGTQTNSLSLTGATSTMNNYQYRCAAINGCGHVYSSIATLHAGTPVTPSITISTASPTTICAGDNVMFGATYTNGGTAPGFQWTKNGSPVGTNNNSYSDNAISNGDIIACTLTSNAGCVTSPTASSNTVAMTVKPIVIPNLTITASTNNVCPGTPITFTSVQTNAGVSPTYSWFINTTNLFLNSPTYTAGTLNDGDYVFAIMQPGEQCIPPNYQVTVSNPVQVHILPALTPSITITASANAICPDGQVLFTAVPVNPGAAPTYQWLKNNNPVGINSSTYTAGSLANGDIIRCQLTASSQQCLVSTTASAVAPVINIYNSPVVSLDKTQTLCANSSRQLDAGNFAGYLWSNGSLARTLSVSSAGTYYVTVTDNNGCHGSDTTHITDILPAPSGFLPADTSVCSYGSISIKAEGSYRSYQWNTNATGPSITITQPGDYTLEVTDNNNCKGRETITVSPKECMKGFYIPNAFTPNGDGHNDTFMPMLFGNIKQYRFQVFNRWGQPVFQTSIPGKGWDGTLSGIQQDTNVFAWVCTYQFDGEPLKTERGTVVVIR